MTNRKLSPIQRIVFVTGTLAFLMTIIFFQDRGFVVHLLQVSESIPPGTPVIWQQSEVGRVVKPRSFQMQSAVRFHPAFRNRIPRGSILVIPIGPEHEPPPFLQLKIVDPFSPPLKKGDTLRVRPVEVDRMIVHTLTYIDTCESQIQRIPRRLRIYRLQRAYENVLRTMLKTMPPDDWRKKVDPYLTELETMRIVRFCARLTYLYENLSPRRQYRVRTGIQRLKAILGCPDQPQQHAHRQNRGPSAAHKSVKTYTSHSG